MTRHRLSISDPMFFQGPDGPNKVLADGIGVIKGSPQWQVELESYLLSVLHPFIVDGEDVRQLIVTPRHVGETLANVIHRDSWVNVARVKPGITLHAGYVYDGSEFIGWAICWYSSGTRITNRWTRAAGGVFRNLIRPAMLERNRAAASTQPLGCT